MNSAGLLKSVAANVPRLDWLDPVTGGIASCPSVLREGGATNNILNSTDSFTNWITGANLSKPPVDVIGIMGVDLTVNVAGGELGVAAGRYSRAGLSLTLTSGLTYTISFLVKKTSTHSVFGYYALATNDLGGGFNVDTMTTGQIYGNAAFGSRVRRITPMGNDVYLCEETFTMTSTRTMTQFNCAPVSSVTSPNNPGVSARIAFAAPQVELGSRATSRILTLASAVTRNADVITVTPPSGVTEIITTFQDGTTDIETTIPGTFTLPEGRIKSVVML